MLKVIDLTSVPELSKKYLKNSIACQIFENANDFLPTYLLKNNTSFFADVGIFQVLAFTTFSFFKLFFLMNLGRRRVNTFSLRNCMYD